MFTRGRALSVALLVALALALTACSPGGAGGRQSVVRLQADYPPYDEQTLVEGAEVIVEGIAVSSESTVLKPRYEGDSAEENPYLGMSEDQKKEALEKDGGVAATAVTFRVNVVYKGAIEPGQARTFIQTGGTIGTVTYQVDGVPLLVDGERYILFGAESHDRSFSILGGSAGAYRSVGGGVFAPVNADTAPYRELSASKVRALTG